jgi:hypothetical protein
MHFRAHGFRPDLCHSKAAHPVDAMRSLRTSQPCQCPHRRWRQTLAHLL